MIYAYMCPILYCNVLNYYEMFNVIGSAASRSVFAATLTGDNPMGNTPPESGGFDIAANRRKLAEGKAVLGKGLV